MSVVVSFIVSVHTALNHSNPGKRIHANRIDKYLSMQQNSLNDSYPNSLEIEKSINDKNVIHLVF